MLFCKLLLFHMKRIVTAKKSCVNALLQASAFPRRNAYAKNIGKICVNALLQASAFPPPSRMENFKGKKSVNALLQASAFPLCASAIL